MTKKLSVVIIALMAITFFGCKKEVPVDHVAICREAAEKGDANAQYELCIRHENGDGVEKTS